MMPDQFSALQDFELNFSKYATLLENESKTITKKTIEDYARELGGFNKALNLALKEYAQIDYTNDPDEKIRASARLKYAYDLLSLLTEILRMMEKNPAVSDIAKQLLVLDEFLLRRSVLVQSTYAEAARRELESFHDPSVRKELDDFLKKKLGERKTNEG